MELEHKPQYSAASEGWEELRGFLWVLVWLVSFGWGFCCFCLVFCFVSFYLGCLFVFNEWLAFLSPSPVSLILVLGVLVNLLQLMEISPLVWNAGSFIFVNVMSSFTSVIPSSFLKSCIDR